MAGLVIAIAAGSASPARAGPDPAGRGYVGAYRCCFRYEVYVSGGLSVDFSNPPVTDTSYEGLWTGQWFGFWDWDQVGISTFQEYSARGGQLVPLAAQESEVIAEDDSVKDREANPPVAGVPGITYSTNVPDKTGQSGGGRNCETHRTRDNHSVVRYAQEFPTTAHGGPIDLVPGGPVGAFACAGPSDTIPNPGPLSEDANPGGANYTIPGPAFASFASGDATHTVTCTVTQFKTTPAEVDSPAWTFKGSRTAEVSIQYFPKRELGREEKDLKTNPDSRMFQVVDIIPTLDLDEQGSIDPTTPFKNPPKNGCRKGS
jgi:hypothetical protein